MRWLWDFVKPTPLGVFLSATVFPQSVASGTLPDNYVPYNGEGNLVGARTGERFDLWVYMVPAIVVTLVFVAGD